MTEQIKRKITRQIKVGDIPIGGGAPIVVQSMNASPSGDFDRNLEEIQQLYQAGCALTRFSVPDQNALTVLERLVPKSPLPIVADIHFDWRLALGALEAGAAALRLNPGNIPSREGLQEVARRASQQRIPIRIGVNAGSLSTKSLTESRGNVVLAMVQTALDSAALLEEAGHQDICLSLKASNPVLTIQANRQISQSSDYPLHLGVTESGLSEIGALRSAVGIGTLLAEGVGDTIRVSLTGSPVEEVRIAYEILQALDLDSRYPTLISCPGCGRTAVDIRRMAQRVQDYLNTIHLPIQVAVMGCAVNGPGEARQADIGIAGGKGEFILFSKGQIIAKYKEEEAFDQLVDQIDQWVLKHRQ